MSDRNGEREVEFWRFVSNCDDESDRGLVLASSAYLELCVERALAAYLLESESATRLLRRDGPLGSHSAKVDLCYCLGVVDKKEFSGLRLFARIRNEFAHKLMADFNSRPIADRVLEFARGVCLDELSDDVRDKLREKGPRSLLIVSTFILADWLRNRDLLVAEMADDLRFDFSEMHRRVQDILEEAEEAQR